MPAHKKLAPGAIKPDDLASMLKGGAAKPAKVTVSPKWKCTFYPIYTCLVISARANATIEKPWKSPTREKILPIF